MLEVKTNNKHSEKDENDEEEELRSNDETSKK